MRTINKLNKLYKHASNLEDLQRGSQYLFDSLKANPYYKIKFYYEVYDEDNVCIIVPYNTKNREWLLTDLKKIIKRFKHRTSLKIQTNFNLNGAYFSDGQFEINLSTKQKDKVRY